MTNIDNHIQLKTTRLISGLEYDEWVSNWRKQEYTARGYTSWASIFKKERENHTVIQTGFTFEFDILSYLLSTPGVVTIKIRFGLQMWKSEETQEEQTQFHLILFGVDNAQEVMTPYFTSYAVSERSAHHFEEEEQGNLPRILMKKWEKTWRSKASDNEVDQTTFKIRYGFLQGYNYPLTEFMGSLSRFTQAPSIHIRFGLHEYYDVDNASISNPNPLYAFGLILYASKWVESSKATLLSAITSSADDQLLRGDYTVVQKDAVEEDSGYYDLTAPCPRTC